MLATLLVALIMPKWYAVKDAYRIHERYEVKYADGSVRMIGEFYEVAPGDIRWQCADGGKVYPATSDDRARSLVVDFCAQ